MGLSTGIDRYSITSNKLLEELSGGGGGDSSNVFLVGSTFRPDGETIVSDGDGLLTGWALDEETIAADVDRVISVQLGSITPGHLEAAPGVGYTLYFDGDAWGFALSVSSGDISGTEGIVPMYAAAGGLEASRIRSGDTTLAAVEIAGLTTDTLATLYVGSAASGYSQTAIVAESYGGTAIAGSSTSSDPVVTIDQAGSGGGLEITAGAGDGVSVVVTSGTAIAATTGTGIAVEGLASGSGRAGRFYRNVSGASAVGVEVIVDHAADTGVALNVQQDGTNHAVFVSANGAGNGLNVVTSTVGNCALFNVNQGAGTASTTTQRNIIIGQDRGTNVFRVDRSGVTFSNGGYLAAGADFAERFRVRGLVSDYRPGDLLEIDPDRDRQVRKSSRQLSQLVLGVYSQRPAIQGADSIDDAELERTVPVGVLGTVPVRCNITSGRIRRGDLLVASHIPGQAMRLDDRDAPPGAIIGQALEALSEREGLVLAFIFKR